MKRQLPKNIRQIGNVSDNTKIYVEDYVDTFFSQLCEKAERKAEGAFLVGEIVREEEESYIYVYGAIQMQEITQRGIDIVVGENTWRRACETCKEFFEDGEILGWFVTTVGQPLEINQNLLKIHQKFFSREKSILVLKDAREKEEKYFLQKFRDLMECAGHYIYYEKNIEMQNYMISIRKNVGMTPSETIEDSAAKNFRSVVRDKMTKTEKPRHSKFTYVLSMVLVLSITVVGVTMMSHYDKMQGVQDSLDKLNQNVVAQEKENEKVIETIGNIVSANVEKEKVEVENEVKEEVETEVKEEVETVVQNLTEELDESEDVYTVEKGDTIAVISQKVYGDMTHMDAICKMNGLENGNLIFIGQKLLLP